MQISYPRADCVRIRDVSFFARPEDRECRRFVAALFLLPEVQSVEISTARSMAEVRFDRPIGSAEIARRIGNLAVPEGSGRQLPALRVDDKGRALVLRHGPVLSTWTVASDLSNRLRVRNSRLFRKKKLCHEVERELMTVLGIERFKVNPMTGSVLIHYDSNAIDKAQILEFLDQTLQNAEGQPTTDTNKHELLLCTATMGIAAVGQFALRVLLVPAGILFVFTVLPTFFGARDTIFKERRLGVDVLDSIVAVMCLYTGQIFAGAVLAWCLSFGRALLRRAQEDSRRRLVNVFGKQPRSAWLVQDGGETLVPLERIRAGDIIAVHTGETIAADGVVRTGNAVVDQHALTGESVPVEKEAGSRVFAATVVIGGKLLISVERAGKDTTTAKISAILNETTAFRLTSQSRGETMADKAVIPTLALASLGWANVGVQGAMAIINCDFGTGIRMAAPLALLSSLSVCANRGILVKDGRALEQMDSVDAVLFDKTGTLTHEQPEVGRIHCLAALDETRILTYAAAAERRLEHPIARAIVERFRTLGHPWPDADRSSYKIGYGITVRVGRRQVHVGSSRFMTLEKIDVPDEVRRIEAGAHADGHSIVFVATDGAVTGAIELAPRLRPGVRDIVAGLRLRGVRQIVIISGDHERPTRKLAQELGIDRYFAEVLPEDKAKYVELLQREGRNVCYVGDGINDSIALKRANVSVSLRGATSAATDTAQIVFLEDNLWKLCEFIDISRDLDRNVKASWQLILAPNLLCIAGVFVFGFGVMASVLANVAAIAALANGLRPRLMYGDEPIPARLAREPATARERSLAWQMAMLTAKFLMRRSSPPLAAAVSAAELARLMALVPNDTGLKRTASFFLWAGLGGVVLPLVPSWPLLVVSIALFSAGRLGGLSLDRWISRTFPHARDQAIRFAHALMRDLKRRFPDAPPPLLLPAGSSTSPPEPTHP
jgi:Cu2+-exporting ATPase